MKSGLASPLFLCKYPITKNSRLAADYCGEKGARYEKKRRD